MLFSTAEFWIFFAGVFAAFWFLKNEKHRVSFLLAVSYYFYGKWDWRFLALIWYVTAVAYWGGKLVHNEKDPAKKKKYLWLCITSHLFILGFFKYFNFFTDSIQTLFAALGYELAFSTLHIILPVGISFYIFQAISYNVDIYRKHIDTWHSLKDVAFYIAFFPQLVAGPIVRAYDFFPQIYKRKMLKKHVVLSAIRLIAIGLIYKVVLADNISPYVDSIYSNIPDATQDGMVLATLGFYSQIYFDFAGYTFIAIGIARLLGFRIPKNFNYPYTAQNVSDFWHRWHISLSSWLRDYLYIPLGGNRRGQARMYTNLLATMVLGGLWHGAAWTFLLWGGLHGLALCIHKIYRQTFPLHQENSNLFHKLFSLLLTQYTVLIGWIFFRAESFGDAITVLNVFINPASMAYVIAGSGLMLALTCLPLAVDHGIGRYHKTMNLKGITLQSNLLVGLLIGAGAGIYMFLIPLQTQPFVYFQF